VKLAILLLAAGRGTRLGADVPKAYLRLDGCTLLEHSAARLLDAFAPRAGAPTAPNRPTSLELVLVVHPDDRSGPLADCLPALERLAAGRAVVRTADGGATRQDSMANGLAAAAADTDFVVVHDAARALVPAERCRACLDAAVQHGAALLAVPVPDTLKRAPGGLVAGTVDRTDAWLAQTPQIARKSLFADAVRHARATGFAATDDVSLIEHLGARVAVVHGSPSNLKITRPEDLPLARAILREQHP
jgi:2-C-methyl-D-erythritol 4-phosphate cytidylyltransferase